MYYKKFLAKKNTSARKDKRLQDNQYSNNQGLKENEENSIFNNKFVNTTTINNSSIVRNKENNNNNFTKRNNKLNQDNIIEDNLVNNQINIDDSLYFNLIIDLQNIQRDNKNTFSENSKLNKIDDIYIKGKNLHKFEDHDIIGKMHSQENKMKEIPEKIEFSFFDNFLKNDKYFISNSANLKSDIKLDNIEFVACNTNENYKKNPFIEFIEYLPLDLKNSLNILTSYPNNQGKKNLIKENDFNQFIKNNSDFPSINQININFNFNNYNLGNNLYESDKGKKKIEKKIKTKLKFKNKFDNIDLKMKTKIKRRRKLNHIKSINTSLADQSNKIYSIQFQLNENIV